MPEFRARINAYADEVLEPDQLRPRLRIDAPLSLTRHHARTSCGASIRSARSGWAIPARSSTPARSRSSTARKSIKERHLSMTFNQEGRRFRAIAWRAAEQAEFLDRNRAGVNLAFSLERNEYQGETYLELNVADIKALSDLE